MAKFQSELMQAVAEKVTANGGIYPNDGTRYCIAAFDAFTKECVSSSSTLSKETIKEMLQFYQRMYPDGIIIIEKHPNARIYKTNTHGRWVGKELNA